MDGEKIRLAEMDGASFREYRAGLIRDYALDKVTSGAWSQAEAEDRAAGEIDDLLPEGSGTRDHFVLTVRDESVPAEVGVTWFAVEGSGGGRRIWVYDILIQERFRRRGYGTRALELIEERARALGADQIGLHVFGHNHGARKLYEALGYRVSDLTMTKTVPVEAR